MRNSVVAFLLIVSGIAAPAWAQPYTAKQTEGIVRLEDAKSQTSVSIIPTAADTVVEMLVKGQNILHFPYASLDDFRARPGWRGGIPLLGPWANRLDEQAFYANGKRYAFDMQLGNVSGNVPLHGFISATDKWQVVEVKADRTGAWLTARLDFYKEPAWMKQFPFAHTIEMTHRLSEGALEVRVTLKNMSSEPMPVSIGFHSWYRLTDSPREEWTVTMPAKSRLLLTDQKVPAGPTEPMSEFFVNGQGALKDYDLDDLFSDITRDANGRATVTLKGRTQRLDIVTGPKYPALVLFSPNPARTGRGSAGSGAARGRGGAPGAPAGGPAGAPTAPAGGAANAPAAPGQAAAAAAPAGPARAGGPGRGGATNSNFIAIEPMAAISNGMNLAQKGTYKELQSIAPGGTWTESFWVKPSGF